MEIARDIYLNRLIQCMHNGLIKVITGIRRSGKSYLIFEIFRRYLLQNGKADAEHIVVMQFDRWENRKYRNPDIFMQYLQQQLHDDDTMYYILLDEVQLLEHFTEVLNSLLYRPNVDVYVTGSNSKFLSKDVVTEFRGRGDELHIFPLSFSEYTQTSKEDISVLWQRYMVFGGLPRVATMQTDEQRMMYLKNLFQETYLRDIEERNHLERPQEMEDLLNVLASSIGALTNPSKILATFQSKLKSKISLNTIRQYITYLEDAFIIDEAKRYDVKGRKYIGTPLKYYFEDVGLRNARLEFRQIEETHLMENILYNELRYRGFQVDVGSVTERYMDKASGKRLAKQLEVDFIANLGSKRYYIQSAYNLPDEEKRQQEKASLLALDDSFKKIIVVGRPIVAYHDDDGILTIGLFDFLLHSDSLEW